MKRYIIALLLLACVCPQLAAQKKKRTWGEVNFAVEQNFMLAKHFDDPEKNDMLPNMSIQYFMFGVDVRIVDEFGAFFNMGFGITRYQRGFADDYNVFDRIELEEYYKENTYNKNDNKGISSRGSFGFFYRLHRNNWTFIPQAGFGVSYFYHSRLSYSLKKIDGNDKFDVNYGINKRDNENYNGQMSFVMLKLKAERKLSNKFTLNFTAEYDLYIQKPKYTAEYSNFYNDAIVETKSMKGNQLHGLTLGVGIGFR